ncbi:3-hydroxyanthranilate 3,4-dioxygenase [Bifiguratus adelaidae]|uniref:3-hydroxyanthranilate 3,4-dioxygenase n=1 Tax=Bifiguratus adelaidae TaxID=1938954 RepID=A0A261Y0W8_9FUNG|nr:3-hydroxyanthranilate 3,4-dioxygenase [Bifiguratus adelaidae]
MLPPPIKFTQWLVDNAAQLAPPVNNKIIYQGKDFTIQAVGGPNKRTDYHINETEEWFYQHKGAMCLKVVDNGEFRDIEIGEGEMFLLPGNTPHNPVRFADTIGIVIERVRAPEHIDRLRWYCSNCREIVHEASFHCTDLGTQLKPIIEEFAHNEQLRTCNKCGTVNTAK